MACASPSSRILEQLDLGGCANSMTYCKMTQDLLVCNSYLGKIEHLTLAWFAGPEHHEHRRLKFQTMVDLKKQLGVRSSPTSVHAAGNMGLVFIGCEANEGIYVVNARSYLLVKKLAQNLNRDFDYMVVDDGSDDAENSCVIYISSVNSNLLTKIYYNTGSVIGELQVDVPTNVELDYYKLYLLCQVDTAQCVAIVEKNTLEIVGKIAMDGWSALGGLCWDESRRLCVTACCSNKPSMQAGKGNEEEENDGRFIYRFDDRSNLVDKIRLTDFDDGDLVVDMVVIGDEFVILSHKLGRKFSLTRIQRNAEEK